MDLESSDVLSGAGNHSKKTSQSTGHRAGRNRKALRVGKNNLK